MPPDPYPELPAVLDVASAAELLQVNERTVRKLITRGSLRHVRLGRLIRIPRHELLEFLGANREAGRA